MRYILMIGLLAAACTKPNPAAAGECCTDAADCAASGIPASDTCSAEMTCTNHQCIANAVCAASADCSTAAPYCATADSGQCEATCSGDGECPGFGQGSSDTFCVSGACVACRDAMNDCPTAAPICTANACGTCSSNDQCPSGACAPDGSCVDESQIAYVDSGGVSTGACSHAAPCNAIAYALAQTTAPYVVIAPGTYTTQPTLTIVGPRVLIGSGSGTTAIRRSEGGTVVTVTGSGTVTLDHLDIGESQSSGSGAYGVYCAFAAAMRIDETSIHDNAGDGLYSETCSATITSTSFTNNGGIGANVKDTSYSFDRCLASGNGEDGFFLDGGTYTLINSFSVRNKGDGIDVYSLSTGNRFEFNTIVDNAIGVYCVIQGGSATAPNNIIARNTTETSAPTETGVTGCTFPNSLIATDISAIMFKSPDTAPYDYHIQHGSSAIDQASASTVDHDFDGDHRPMGSASDLGADEEE